ncbi:transducin/WD40 repeat-like superfamily protein [Wolffia australiana]
MDFTEAYEQTGPCCFSPNGRFLAIAVDYRLVIRDVASLKVVVLFSCVDKISNIEWAFDSEYVLCVLYKRPMVQVWSLSRPEWTCKIDEGPAGISSARWSPDSRHILTTSDFQLRLTVWSLVNTACVHVQWPKQVSKGVSFTHDGKFAAVCTRSECKDHVILLSCQTWEIMGSFSVDTVDLAGVEWSPDDTAIAVWDSSLEYKVIIYSPDGRCLFKYSAYGCGLGIKTVAWSPCGQFLAVGSFDQTVRVLNRLTWKIVAEFVHSSSIRIPSRAVVFKEVEEPMKIDVSGLRLTDDCSDADNIAEGHFRVKFKVMDPPFTLPFQKPPPDKPNPKQGIGLLTWSHNSQFLLSRNDSMAGTLWVWDIYHLELAAVLAQKEAVRAATWNPSVAQLVLSTCTPHVYMWAPGGAFSVAVPLPGFHVSDVRWSPDGSCLLLRDKDSFCCAALPPLEDSLVDHDVISSDEDEL